MRIGFVLHTNLSPPSTNIWHMLRLLLLHDQTPPPHPQPPVLSVQLITLRALSRCCAPVGAYGAFILTLTAFAPRVSLSLTPPNFGPDRDRRVIVGDHHTISLVVKRQRIASQTD